MTNGIKFNPQPLISPRSHLSPSSELVELKIEEFLASYEKELGDLTEEAFSTQVCVCVYFWSSCCS